ncbi:helix-turn-helix domain-containing protein [Myroides ceti]|uniref:Helix-turn-helix domain-containing protein n=2 Tax=Paenimyroides ceti TaxID=395087 RepID=A0ABT8D145_9FLAO|nr:helix-turn-helix domain-containing protein [Paenimyroides ceti]MDN3707054.1 helix-turn-helix domain-containing protein [Paenimyroides ceti]MDN3710081.1 helix-turn-helix domain-containing protein [Paenimyroides ceti]
MINFQLTEQLKTNGFSINTLKKIISFNGGKRNFNTLDYYCIYIVFDYAIITVEGIEYEIKGPNIVYIGPHNNITYQENTEEENTYLIAFSASFYERSAKDSMFLNSELFYNLTEDIFISPTRTTEHDIKRFAIERLELYQDKDSGLYNSIAHNTIEALILDGFLNIGDNSLEATRGNFENIDIVNRFRVMLHTNYKQHKIVKYYADKLNITPRRLTEMTEQVLGKTPKQIITERLLQESIRLLKHSKVSIGEISFELDFNDEGNFGHFIKKHTGKTPKEIRNQSIIEKALN